MSFAVTGVEIVGGLSLAAMVIGLSCITATRIAPTATPRNQIGVRHCFSFGSEPDIDLSIELWRINPP
jgi:hypothetical protein